MNHGKDKVLTENEFDLENRRKIDKYGAFEISSSDLVFCEVFKVRRYL